MTKILFSNIGYARGIDGTLGQTLKRLGRYIYLGRDVQMDVLKQLRCIINLEQPDLCCLVEVDQGSLHSDNLNQIEALMDDDYAYFDIANKYGEGNKWRRFSFLQGRSNAFLTNRDIPFERVYFENGTKRLMHKLYLADESCHVFFGHFSLNRDIRALQLMETAALIKACEGDVVLLADFNIWHGFSELQPLIDATGLIIHNKPDDYTFRFHNQSKVLDLCLSTPNIGKRLSMRVIDQPYSDHDALLVSF